MRMLLQTDLWNSASTPAAAAVAAAAVPVAVAAVAAVAVAAVAAAAASAAAAAAAAERRLNTGPVYAAVTQYKSDAHQCHQC